jgi:hypothetical protein
MSLRFLIRMAGAWMAAPSCAAACLVGGWLVMVWAFSPALAAAELLPVSPLPEERSLWINFEILSADGSQTLPESLREVEGGRLQTEEATVNGQSYRKTSMILPLANGDRRETILLLAEEKGRMRMLGFHRIHRHREVAEETTIVFQSGAPNPLTGEPWRVPADTYTYLAFCTALSSFKADRPSLPVHVWLRNAAVPMKVVVDGKETLEALGTRVPALRLRLRPKSGSDGEATYWFAEAPPHALVQYRGPGDFVAAPGDSIPGVLLRATASSEQVRKIFPN